MHRDKIRIHTKLIAGSPGDGNRILDSCPNIHLVPYTNPEEVRSTFLVWYGAGRPSSGRLHLSRSQFSSLRHSSLFRRSRFATVSGNRPDREKSSRSACQTRSGRTACSLYSLRLCSQERAETGIWPFPSADSFHRFDDG